MEPDAASLLARVAALERENERLRQTLAAAAQGQSPLPVCITDATFMRSVLAASSDCIKVLELDGRLTFMSEGGMRVMEVSDFNAIAGCPWPDFWEGAGHTAAQAAIAEARDGRPAHFEGAADTLGGNPRWWDVRVSPILGADGRPERILSVSRDVTARKLAEQAVVAMNDTLEARVASGIAERRTIEEALRQAQKMEAVGQLTGGLAHDFNNLLAGIGGSLELIQRRMAQGRPDETASYVTSGLAATKRAAALAHRLLAFSRRQPLDPKPTDVDHLIAGMEELIRRTVGPAVEVRTASGNGLWGTLVDRNQLENALLNLCINARDAMPDGGRLTIGTANRTVDGGGDSDGPLDHRLAPGDYVALSVTDSGAGMSQDTIDRAFEPFFTTKPMGLGTGLGLSMVYGFARQSGGEVTITSEVGRGTTVCLSLPRHAAVEARESLPVPPLDHVARRGESVLVVDDDDTVRMVLVDVLVELGYRAVEASDGPGALALLQDGQRHDLLITDVGLPGGLNGRQLADACRVSCPGLRVLFVTGYAETAVIGNFHNGVLAEGMSILTKPFTIDALTARLKVIFD